MIAEDAMEHYNEEYGELDETDVHSSDTNFYDGSNKKIQTKKSKVSNGKRPCFNSSISFSKKRKETTRDRLLKWNSFYSSEKFGIFVQCVKCKKWRKVLEYEEEQQVPKDWWCAMNLSGPKDCKEPECLEEDDFTSSRFVPGSIVWAKLAGYPWWPAMVEDDPDVEEYYWEEERIHYYNVTFLDDKVTHAWVPEFAVISFLKDPPKEHIKSYRIKYSQLIEKAKEKANAAIAMPITDRLKTFSFAELYKGKWPLAKSFGDDDDDNTELTKMLIKEVEDMESIKFTDSENEMDSSVEVYDPVSKTNEIKESSMSDNKIMNSKHNKLKMYSFQPKNSNKKLGSISDEDDHLVPEKTQENETIHTSDNCIKKNNLIEKFPKETIPYKRKKIQNKPEHVLSKLDKNELLNSNSMKPVRRRIMHVGMSLSQSKCPNKFAVTKKSEVKGNKSNEKTELKIKKGESNNNKLSNIKKIKTFIKDDMTEKRILQSPSIKSVSSKINSKKSLSFQPPVKTNATTTSKEGKKESLKNNNSDRTNITILGCIQNEESVSELDISDEEQSELQEEKAEIENEQEIRENTRICEKNEAEKNIHKSRRENKSKKQVNQSLNSDSEDIFILDSIPNNHREKSVSEQTEDFFEEEKSKPEQAEFENKQETKQKVKIFKKDKEVNVHNSKGKQKSCKLAEASIITENVISEDNVFIKNSDGSKTQDKLKAKELIISKETKKDKGEKSVSSNDQILEKNIKTSVDNKCSVNSAINKNDTFSKCNPQNENAKFSGGIANNIENEANIKTTRSEKNDSKLRQKNTNNNEKQKKLEKKCMKNSKPNASGINDKIAEPKQTPNKKYENKKTNEPFSNSTKSNICKQGNVAIKTMPNGQCNAKVSKDIETSKEKSYLLRKQNKSEEKPRTNIPQKIQKTKISDKNHANRIETEETLVTLNKFDNKEQENYSFSLEMNNEQNENEDSDPFEVD